MGGISYSRGVVVIHFSSGMTQQDLAAAAMMHWLLCMETINITLQQTELED